MTLSPIIRYLRTTLPVWFSRVDAAASVEIALDKSRIELDSTKDTLPAFYLVLRGDEVTNTILQPEPEVTVETIVSVIAVLKNQDAVGRYAQDQIHDIRKLLFVCLFNKIFDDDSYSLMYVRGHPIFVDNARYCYEFQFKQISRFDASDGAQLTLDDFNKLYADWYLAPISDDATPNAQDRLEPLYLSSPETSCQSNSLSNPPPDC